MITEEERIADEKESLRKEREFLTQQIKAGERYERLISNKDFQDMLVDLENTLKIHQGQLDILDGDLHDSDSPFKMARIGSVRKTHLIRMMQIKIAIRRPKRIVEIGNEAKQRLIKIAEREREIIHG